MIQSSVMHFHKHISGCGSLMLGVAALTPGAEAIAALTREAEAAAPLTQEAEAAAATGAGVQDLGLLLGHALLLKQGMHSFILVGNVVNLRTLGGIYTHYLHLCTGLSKE